MDGMFDAIKKRRGGLLNDQEENSHQEMPEGKGELGMQGLVQSLSDEQKSQLLSLLVKDQGQSSEGEMSDAPAIQQGAMGPGEEMELAEQSGDYGEHESEEEIMESMVSSADKGRVEQGAKPRNLGERVKMSLASKLKGKGKY